MPRRTTGTIQKKNGPPWETSGRAQRTIGMP